MTYIVAILTALLGAVSLYSKGQSHKIDNLNEAKKEVEGQLAVAKRVAKISDAKASLHRDVSRAIVKNNTLETKKVEKIQKKIDRIGNNENFTVSI